MADKDHLEFIGRGSGRWNRWRADHPDVTPDLRDADLGWAELDGANLRAADLTGADLSEAKLNHADLRGAVLVGAYLRETELSGADLGGADMTDAELRDADLHRAKLVGARLGGASLTEAVLDHADLTGARLDGVDLTHAELAGAVLKRASLAGARLRCATLAGADLGDADLSGVIVRRSDRSPPGKWSLQLLQASGVRTARFSGLRELATIAEEAFRYAHTTGGDESGEANARRAVRSMRVLVELLPAATPRPELLPVLSEIEAGLNASAPASAARLEDDTVAALEQRGHEVALTAPSASSERIVLASNADPSLPGGECVLELSRRPTGEAELGFVRDLYCLWRVEPGTNVVLSTIVRAGGTGLSTYTLARRDHERLLDWINQCRSHGTKRWHIGEGGLLVAY